MVWERSLCYSYDFYDTVYFGDTVLFEGDIYDQPGSYAVHYSTDNGCDSTHTLHLVGRNIQMVERYYSICQGDTFYFFGRPLTVAGTYADTNFTGEFLLGDTVVICKEIDSPDGRRLLS